MLSAKLRSHYTNIRLAAEGAYSMASIYLRLRRPLILNHLVTVRCNLACPFCYVSGPEQREFNREHYPKRSEMNTAEMCDFYRQLISQNFKLSVIVGGEPLLRTDLDDILKVPAGRLWASVFTNGMLLADRVELLRRAPSVFVSLDAPDDQHDQLRAQPGCFGKAIAGIETLRRRYPKIIVAVNMTVTEQNVARVPDMIAFARELKLPIAFQPPTYDGQFALDERPSTNASLKVPQSERVAEAFRAIQQAAQRQPIIGSRAFFGQIIKDRPTYRCHYPAYVLGPVLPNGDVVACTTKGVIGNVRDTPVKDVLNSSDYRANAAAGPDCQIGCRDWGIFDVSAVHNRKFDIVDLRRYVRTFVVDKQPASTRV